MIKITDRFYIDASSNCYILKEKKIIQDKNSKNYGQEVFEEIGYYTSIETVVMGFIKTKTREFISKSEKNSIEDLIKEIQKTNEFIEKLDLKGV